MTSTKESPAVKIENLTKVFDLPWKKGKGLLAVDNVSIEVAPGEIYGLIGPNGSGKSTTMKALLGLVKPTSGTTKIFGVNSNEVRSRENVGYLPENPYFYKHLTGRETLNFYAQLSGLPKKERKQKIDGLLELVDLTGAKDRRLQGYSKGMLQRIGLAQALIQEPRLLVLDEPTAGVDPTGSSKIRDLILQLKSQGISVFLCSHLLEQVQQVCDRVGIIHLGKIAVQGSVEELVSIENQTEIIVENSNPQLEKKIRELIATENSSELVKIGTPKTTLENLFLKETK